MAGEKGEGGIKVLFLFMHTTPTLPVGLLGKVIVNMDGGEKVS